MRFLAIVLFASLLAVQAFADLNTVKKDAVKRADSNVANIKKLTEDTSVEVDKRVGNIKVIATHQREFGDGIFKEALFEVKKTARSGYMMAHLLGSPNDVFRCIEKHEREALAEIEKLYQQKFLDVGRDYEMKAEQYQRDLIKNWKDDYYRSIEQYGKIYQKTVSDIQRARSESEVISIIKGFDQTTDKMAEIILSVLPGMTTAQIQVLKVFNELVYNFQQYTRYRIDETTKAIYKCFPNRIVDEPEVF